MHTCTAIRRTTPTLKVHWKRLLMVITDPAGFGRIGNLGVSMARAAAARLAAVLLVLPTPAVTSRHWGLRQTRWLAWESSRYCRRSVECRRRTLSWTVRRKKHPS